MNMRLQKGFHNIKRYTKSNAPSILSGIAVLGVIGTAVSAAKATPKALQIIDINDELKIEREGTHLTMMEKIICAGPIYIPSILMGAGTITCILSANHLNQQRQAMLTSAYGYIHSRYNEYKNKVEEMYGQDFAKQVELEIAKDHYKDYQGIDVQEEKLFYDKYSHRYFNASFYDIQTSIYNINRTYALEGEVTLNDVYHELCLDEMDYGDVIGWSGILDWETDGYAWLDISWEPMEMPDDLECYAIVFPKDPTEEFRII